VNHRLENGENGDTLLPWLNGLPEVQSVLTRHFSGSAINKQNLSEWRARGFVEWQSRQATLADARELAADSTSSAGALPRGARPPRAPFFAPRGKRGRATEPRHRRTDPHLSKRSVPFPVSRFPLFPVPSPFVWFLSLESRAANV